MKRTKIATRYEDICSIPKDVLVPVGGAWQPEKVYITKGVLDHEAYREYAERIKRQFPEAKVVMALDKSWNSADSLPGMKAGQRFDEGKKTLVLAIRDKFITSFDGIFTDVRCPSFLRAHFQDLCPFRCSYCYLTAATTTRIAPQPKIFVNLDTMFQEVREHVRRHGHVFLSAGELQDSLALERFAGQAAKVAQFFAGIDARILFLTKSDCVDTLLHLDHQGHTVLSWSLNADEITRTVEQGTAPLAARINAARLAQQAGYPIRFRFDPLLAEGAHWTLSREKQYRDMVRCVFCDTRPERITLGTFRAVPGCKAAHDARVASGNVVPAVADGALERIGEDRRWRYHDELRRQMYGSVIDEIRTHDEDVPIALCKETLAMWRAVGLDPSDCRCNCVEGAVDLS